MLTRPLIFVLIALPLTIGSLLNFSNVFCSNSISEGTEIAMIGEQQTLPFRERGSGRRENPNNI